VFPKVNPEKRLNKVSGKIRLFSDFLDINHKEMCSGRWQLSRSIIGRPPHTFL